MAITVTGRCTSVESHSVPSDSTPASEGSYSSLVTTPSGQELDGDETEFVATAVREQGIADVAIDRRPAHADRDGTGDADSVNSH